MNLLLKQVMRFIKFVYETASQVYRSIHYFFQEFLGIDLDQFTAWLGYLMNWDDMLDTHHVVRQMVTTGLKQVVLEMENLKLNTHEVFNKIRAQLVGGRLPMDRSNEIFGRRIRQMPQQNAHQETPQGNWASNQLQSNIHLITCDKTSISDDLTNLFTDTLAVQTDIIKK